MLTFDTCRSLSDKDVSTLLRHIPRDTLVLAIANANDELRQRFYDNVSAKAVAMIQDDLKAMPENQQSEAAQQEIVSVMRQLREQGELDIPG